MKKPFLYLALCMFLSCVTSQKEIKNTNAPTVIVGTIHVPTAKINADSIYTILNRFKPDIILVEAEATIFEKENTFKSSFDGIDSNEFQGIIKYQKENPAVEIKPAELENRNKIREQLGIYAEAGFVFSEVDRIREEGKLSDAEKAISTEFDNYWDSATHVSKQDLKSINATKSDSIISHLMQFQYHKVGTIINQHSEFTHKKIKGSNGDSLSYKDYYTKWAHFEGKIRNEGIAKNVLKYRKQHPGKKILLLVGFKHRSLIKHYLEKQLQLQEYYD